MTRRICIFGSLLLLGGCCLGTTITSGTGKTSESSSAGFDASNGATGTSSGGASASGNGGGTSASTGTSAGFGTSTGTGTTAGPENGTGTTTGQQIGTGTSARMGTGTGTGTSSGGTGGEAVGTPCDGDGGCGGSALVCAPNGTCLIPAGSPVAHCVDNEALGDPECAPTGDGGAVGCNGQICCNSFQTPDVLTACESNDDCCSGNVCIGGACFIVDGEGDCAGTDFACASGVCGSIDTCSCISDNETASNALACCSGELDDQGVCAANSTLGGSCKSNGDCSSTQVCDPDGGVCRITSAGSGVEPCAGNDCTTWPAPLTCQFWGQCCNDPIGPCTTDTDCCIGSVCSSWPNGGPGVCKGHNGNPCTTDDECLFGCNGSSCN